MPQDQFFYRDCVPEVLFGREGKMREVNQRAQIIRMNTCRVAFRPTRLDVVVGVVKGPRETFELQARQFVPARPLDGFEVVERRQVDTAAESAAGSASTIR